MKRFNLKNKISIITGGAGLLGTQNALALTSLKSKVILIDSYYKKNIKKKKFFNTQGIEVDIFCADICNEKRIIKVYFQYIL